MIKSASDRVDIKRKNRRRHGLRNPSAPGGRLSKQGDFPFGCLWILKDMTAKFSFGLKRIRQLCDVSNQFP